MGNAPKLRFDGFSDAWEQRKWSDTVDISTDMVDPKTGLYDNLPHVAPGNIESFTGRLYDNVKLVKDENLISGKFRFNAGDIIYGKINPQLGKYVFAAFSGLTSADAYVLNAKNGVDQKYLYAVLQTQDFFDYSVSVSKRSGMPKINRDELNAYSFLAPSQEEQARIGQFLLALDNLITFHQRKCNALTKAKAFYLQNLFPQEGEKEPRLRLEGFTDSWDRYTLGDLYTERNERGNETLQILTVSIHTGVSDGALEEDELGKSVRRSEDKTLYKHVYAGDLIFNMMRAWQGAIGVAKREGMISPAYISAIPDERIYPPFMNYLLRRKEIISQINNLSYGVTDFRKRLYWDSFIKVKCCLPSVDEQKSITDVFEQLDILITRQEHRIKALKTMKKFMLQNMFAQEG